ncbi:hypothetical protein BG842_00595 [Haladaptatus sp. W1]|nr:hypothetical protein BG842_11370 [Haladaptatus sp. W1]ODR80934.1 hypothetical protein BG842_00595 [Haladaptatus sp. W1]
MFDDLGEGDVRSDVGDFDGDSVAFLCVGYDDHVAIIDAGDAIAFLADTIDIDCSVVALFDWGRRMARLSIVILFLVCRGCCLWFCTIR